jgi:H/ACA ribonucleoprotein complex subunit 2
VILAADISPMDVISHIPVLCEDHNVPYIYVSSRAELGIAGQTKRPTSVVLLGREGTGKGKGEEGSEWEGVFEGLCKVVQREGASVRV